MLLNEFMIKEDREGWHYADWRDGDELISSIKSALAGLDLDVLDGPSDTFVIMKSDVEFPGFEDDEDAYWDWARDQVGMFHLEDDFDEALDAIKSAVPQFKWEQEDDAYFVTTKEK